jgi:arsenite oxidase large subunit
VPTKIGQACHVWLPAATSGEMNLTSMNGERRMRLTERYMDPPGQAMPDCLIAARLANHMERVLRGMGDAGYTDRFKGFDWQTEEGAFMDGHHPNAKGGEHVTYERLRAMGTNGFQEPAVDFEERARGESDASPASAGASSAGSSRRRKAVAAGRRRRRPRRAGSSAPSGSTPTADPGRRTPRPSSCRPSGATWKRPGRRSRRRSSPT